MNHSSLGSEAGSSCEVACKYPYDGVPGEAICPLGNTDPYFLPTLQSPQCLVDCSRLQPNLPGYRQKVNDTGYECDEGYAGLVKEDCFLQFDGSDPCGTPALLLNGCRPLADCLAPMVDLCQFDVSDCQLVARGDSCEIGCRDPYGGMSTNASCPMNNTNALQGLQKDLPFCSFPECPDPASLPLGYVLHPNGTYGCDRDYIGAAVRTCSAFPVGGGPRLGNAAAGPQCYSEAIFAGCKVIAEIVPCQPPAVDPCLHDASACTGASLEPGGSCEIACRQPYRGTATIADCPLDNINTTGGDSTGQLRNAASSAPSRHCRRSRPMAEILKVTAKTAAGGFATPGTLALRRSSASSCHLPEELAVQWQGCACPDAAAWSPVCRCALPWTFRCGCPRRRPPRGGENSPPGRASRSTCRSAARCSPGRRASWVAAGPLWVTWWWQPAHPATLTAFRRRC
ncbi:unnamed protein product [Effrenium voratum]|nr:unnamed protein product [Effrenium voratum]